MGARPEDWPWSSYRATLREAPCPPWLLREWLLSTFGETERAEVSAHRRFDEDDIGQPGPLEQLRHQVFLGSDTFVEGRRRKLPSDRDLAEIPRAQRRRKPKPLPEYARTHRDQDGAITASYASGGYTLKAIGMFFGLHYAQVSRIAPRGRDVKC
jgi:hypothetical protein